jgi:hypothetical protein
MITGSMHTFLANARRLESLIEVLAKDADAHRAAITSLEQIKHPGESVSRFQEVTEQLGNYLVVRLFVHEWYSVMEVTFAEAFLHDVLVECAAVDPQLMSDSKQSASYEELQGAASLEDVRLQLRGRWAKNFIDRGGPSTWLDRFTRMGAKQFPEGLADRLEELWGVRHLVVHHAGRLTNDFIKRHSTFTAMNDGRLSLDKQKVLGYVQDVSTLVEVVDRFVVNRYGDRLPLVSYELPTSG